MKKTLALVSVVISIMMIVLICTSGLQASALQTLEYDGAVIGEYTQQLIDTCDPDMVLTPVKLGIPGEYKKKTDMPSWPEDPIKLAQQSIEEYQKASAAAAKEYIEYIETTNNELFHDILNDNSLQITQAYTSYPTPGEIMVSIKVGKITELVSKYDYLGKASFYGSLNKEELEYIDPADKVSDELQALMDNTGEKDMIDVWVSARFLQSDYTDKTTLEQQAGIKCGVMKYEAQTSEEVDLYLRTYRHMMYEDRQRVVRELLDLMQIDDSQISSDNYFTYEELGYWPGRFSLTKSDIERIITIERIAAVDVYNNQDVSDDTVYEPPLKPTDTADKYQAEDQFNNAYADLIGTAQSTDVPIEYTELYQHKNEMDVVDWIIVKASVGQPEPMISYALLGDSLYTSGFYAPFATTYAVYTATDNKFHPIEEIYNENSDVKLAFDKLQVGRPIGDIDADKKLTIMDATNIQRCLAKIETFPADDDLTCQSWVTNDSIKYVSDINRDSVRDITDATVIQKKLAKIN